jgi:serine protease
MASPHVAGVAALYLSVNPGATPTQVNQALVNAATTNVVTGAGTGSPNRLLYSRFGGTPPVDAPPTAAFTFSCAGLTCTFNASGSTDDVGIASYTWSWGDGTAAGSGQAPAHTFGSSGTFTVVLTVTDTIGQSDTESRSVTVSSGGGGAPCTNCTAYTGSLSGQGASQYQPNGSYYNAVAGTHRGWLRGPAGTDFDLYLQRWNGLWWVTVAASEGTSSEEQITYAGSSGYYRWRVYAYSGSGAYTFWLQRP